MIWPIRHRCPRCGREDDRHPVPIVDVPDGRARLVVETSCACGQTFAWSVIFGDGRVRDIVPMDAVGA